MKIVEIEIWSNLIAHRARITSFHPFKNARQVKMMLAFRDYFWIFFVIFCIEEKEIKTLP